MQKFSLRDLELIDGPPHPEFDNLTRLAQRTIGAPVALLSTIDSDAERQFFTSQTGLSGPAAEDRHAPLSHSFCQHVIQKDAPVAVEDAPNPPPDLGTGIAQGLGIGSYLGVPVYRPGGVPAAVLAVIDDKPRAWTEADISLLRQLAFCATDAIRTRATMLEMAHINRERREFTYAVSHDLKSPANTLNLLLQELDAERDRLSEDGIFLLEQSQKTAARMMRQMNDILEYSRVVGARIQKRDIDLNTLVGELVQDLQGEIQHAKATVDIGPLPVVTGNRMQLRCLFQNLITNGITFRSGARKPIVSITSVSGANKGQERIDVTDNGAGISTSDQQQIFQLFKKLHNPNEYDGTGIGLTLSRRICSNHNGLLEVSSEVGQGSTFRVTLPSGSSAT